MLGAKLLRTEIHKYAFEKACERYPESIDVLTFFASLAGLFDGVLTMEQVVKARLNAGLPAQEVTLRNEVP